jgi:hypothetical protein
MNVSTLHMTNIQSGASIKVTQFGSWGPGLKQLHALLNLVPRILQATLNFSPQEISQKCPPGTRLLYLTKYLDEKICRINR